MTVDQVMKVAALLDKARHLSDMALRQEAAQLLAGLSPERKLTLARVLRALYHGTARA